MPGFDAFDGDSFTLRALTNAIQKLPYVPGRLGQMGLFEGRGEPVRSVLVEELEGVLHILPTVRPGGPATLKGRSKRKTRSFEIPHIPYEDRILASELQGVREWGTEDQLQSMGTTVNRHLEEMRQSIEATHEYHRMGAITGVVLDADGSTELFNLFTLFETTEQELNMDFSTAGTKQLAQGLEIKSLVEAALGKTPYNHIRVLCEKTFFKTLVTHSQIATAYERWNSGAFLRDDPRFTGFEYPKGVIWEEYRQAQNAVGTLDFIASNEARAFPVGVPNLFIARYAPGPFIETVNTRGIPIYAKQARDPMDRWIDLHVETNPLFLCTRPRCLVKLTDT